MWTYRTWPGLAAVVFCSWGYIQCGGIAQGTDADAAMASGAGGQEAGSDSKSSGGTSSGGGGLGGGGAQAGGDAATTCGGLQVAALKGPGEIPSDEATPEVVGFALATTYGCSVHGDGSVRCWGRYPQTAALVGLAEEPTPVPQVVEGVSNAVQVAVGEGFVCVLLDTQEVACWGQLGLDSYTAPTLISGLGSVAEIGAAGNVACVRRDDGTVHCFGDAGFYMMFSQDASASPFDPYEVPGISNAVSLTVGAESACANLADGTAACWGAMVASDGSGAFVPFPQAGFIIDQSGQPARSVVEVALSSETPAVEHLTCFTSDTQQTFWFSDAAPWPMELPDLAAAQHVALGLGTFCASVQSAVRCWGRYGHLLGKEADYVADAIAVDFPMLTDVLELHMAVGYACARKADGIWCWGSNQFGQLGIGAPRGVTAEPSLVMGIDTAKSISLGGETCVVTEADELWCWGDTPQKRLEGVAGAVSTDDHGCAWMIDGTVQCWSVYAGGDPSVVDGIADVEDLAVAMGSTCAVVADGSVWCWDTGLGSSGLVPGNSTTPVQINGLSDAQAIAMAGYWAGNASACVIGSGGTVACWEGEGATDGAPAYEAQTVLGISGAERLAVSSEIRCALIKDGTLTCWDYADAKGNNVTSPTAVSTVTNVIDVAAAHNLSSGDQRLCVTVENCGVACFGSDLDLTTPPVLVPGTADASGLSTTGSTSCAIVQGEVYCWGQRPLGDGVSAQSLQPVQLVY